MDRWITHTHHLTPLPPTHTHESIPHLSIHPKKIKKQTVLEEGAGEEWSAADEEAGLLELCEVTRAPGLNDVGMVAWKVCCDVMRCDVT